MEQLKLLTALAVLALLIAVIPTSVYSQSDSESDSTIDAYRPIIIIVTMVIVGFIGYKVKQKRSKSILDAYKIIRDPIISVIQNRYSGSNITFLAVFDTNRLLFIRPDKVKNQSENPTLDDMLRMDKKNFQIPYDEISETILQNSKHGINGARGGKLTIHAQKKHQFDILEHESFAKCDMTLKRFLQDKAVVKP